MRPKFTIAIPVYNRRDYLKQAIGSSLAQTTLDFEVIVSDDCSTDDLRTVTHSFGDSRIKYYRSQDRLGPAQNHQLSVALSQGEYVINLHSDDLLLPNYLEVAGQELDRRKEAGAIYSPMAYLIDSKIIGCQTVPKIRFANREVYLRNPWLEKFHNVSPTCCMFRRSVFDQIGGYRKWLRFAYDYDLFMRLMRFGGGVVFFPEVLSVWRRHEEQASQTVSNQGLYDILDLWQLDEYSHWPSCEIADLVLTVLIGAMRRNSSGWVDILGQVRRRGMTARVLWGAPEAVRRKLRRRRSGADAEKDDHYELSTNLNRALDAANALVSNWTDRTPSTEGSRSHL
jgi:glycosyltransferase involved in cell wall biosynthesis